MEKDTPAYQALQEHIKGQVEEMIKEKEEKESSSGIWDKLREVWIFLKENLFHLSLRVAIAGGFGYWTYDIATGPTSNWWAILTGWMALLGIQSLIGLASKRPTDKATTTGDPSIAQVSEGDPGKQPPTIEPPPAWLTARFSESYLDKESDEPDEGVS